MLKILTILVTDRIKEAGRTQGILTEFGHIIKSRLGFHEVSEDKCSRVGVIILQLTGKTEEWDKLDAALMRVEGLEFKSVVFDI
jgi:hypothetical protein